MGLTCFSCHHSRYRYIDTCLWCELHGRVANKRCEDFDREPGADEQERGV